MARNNRNNTQKEKRSVDEKTARYVEPKTLRAGGCIEYRMPRAMIDMLLKEKKINGDVQEYLCNYVNEQYGLLGTCIRVIAG